MKKNTSILVALLLIATAATAQEKKTVAPAKESANTTQTTVKYTAPTLEAPANESNINDPRKPLPIIWTPVIPRPSQGEVTYTVRVYAVEKGQKPVQAIRLNKPMLEKDFFTTQTTWQIPSEYITAKEKATFVWNVQATNKERKGYGENNGVSEYAVFYSTEQQPAPIETKPAATTSKQETKKK